MVLRKGWIISALLLALLALPGLCAAALTGNCILCHTMHNSEQGEPVAFTRNAAGEQVISEQPLANLLRTDCIGCHTNVGTETILEIEGMRVPIVFNLDEPAYPPDGSSKSTLAGGNFHWLINGDAYGHNVGGIAGEDLRFPPEAAPGGVAGACINCHGTLATTTSSCEGCHVPSHHAGGEGAVTGQAHGWYRFLGSVMQRDQTSAFPTEGVVGIEASDWEQSPASDRHNVYQGSAVSYASYLESGAISQKCVGCHGLFHSETGTGSTWLRHPVDVAIPDSGEFASINFYNPLIPVARPTVGSGDAGFDIINLGSDLVSCISCHRPHGSPYPAMLRWGYQDWPGIDSHTQQPAWNGCAFCHTSKG